MANESRAFRITPDIELKQLAEYVGYYLKNEKAMEVQSASAPEGYVIQASQRADGLKTVSGTRMAVTAYFMPTGEVLNVTVGEGQWSDKLGESAVGWFVVWPEAVNAGIDPQRQKALAADIFAAVEKGIALGGQQLAAYNARANQQPGVTVCPNCQTKNSDSARFCKKCGTKLQNKCPKCGAQLFPDSRFCVECGAVIN